jgi:CelD/BcsL family acetyltransferase involved in cellulose biosynthesis
MNRMTSRTVEVITKESALAALRPEWDGLWRRVRSATPFQSSAWLLSWWRHFGTGRPRIALLRSEGRLAGMLPLYILDEERERKLLPLGAGITDYFDALVEPDLPPAAADAMLRAALDSISEDGITSCDLSDIPPDATLRELQAPSGWRMVRGDVDSCPVLAVPNDTKDLRAVVPSRTLRKLRMNRHRAERMGGWTIETATSDTLPGLLEDMFYLHEARWLAVGHVGVLSDPRIRAFHKVASAALLSIGALRLQVLRIGNRAAAACYALLAGDDRLLFYLSGFDPAFAFESPGTILLGAIVEQALVGGRRELHFLRGREAYKYAWGAVDRTNVAFHLTKAPA